MRLTEKDKRCLAAFSHGDACDSQHLWTDGERLDGLWFGGGNIAEWAAGRVVFHDLGSRSAQVVQRALKKYLPSGVFGGFNRGPGEKWIAESLHTGRHRYGRRAEGYTPKLHRHRMHRKAVRVGGLHKGLLHEEMGYAPGEKIPMAALKAELKKRTAALHRAAGTSHLHEAKAALGRVRFAINARRFKHPKHGRRK